MLEMHVLRLGFAFVVGVLEMRFMWRGQPAVGASRRLCLSSVTQHRFCARTAPNSAQSRLTLDCCVEVYDIFAWHSLDEKPPSDRKNRPRKKLWLCYMRRTLASSVIDNTNF